MVFLQFHFHEPYALQACQVHEKNQGQEDNQFFPALKVSLFHAVFQQLSQNLRLSLLLYGVVNRQYALPLNNQPCKKVNRRVGYSIK